MKKKIKYEVYFYYTWPPHLAGWDIVCICKNKDSLKKVTNQAKKDGDWFKVHKITEEVVCIHKKRNNKK